MNRASLPPPRGAASLALLALAASPALAQLAHRPFVVGGGEGGGGASGGLDRLAASRCSRS